MKTGAPRSRATFCTTRAGDSSLRRCQLSSNRCASNQTFDRRGKEGRRVEPLDQVDWNAELVRGDLGKAVQQLKRESGKGLRARRRSPAGIRLAPDRRLMPINAPISNAVTKALTVLKSTAGCIVIRLRQRAPHCLTGISTATGLPPSTTTTGRMGAVMRNRTDRVGNVRRR